MPIPQGVGALPPTKEGMSMNDVTLTPELIHAGRSEAGGWNKAQLKAIGIEWADIRQSGWIERNSGRVVTRDQYDLFLSLVGKKGRK